MLACCLSKAGSHILNHQKVRCRSRTNDCACFLHVKRVVLPFSFSFSSSFLFSSSFSFSSSSFSVFWPVPTLDSKKSYIENWSKFIQPSKSLPRVEQVARHFFSQTSHRSKMALSSGYNVRKNGAANTLDHRIYIEKDGFPISPFHDIPLYANDQQTVLNMIVEIPRWTNAKMEVKSSGKPFLQKIFSAMRLDNIGLIEDNFTTWTDPILV